jgi:hypothetical protein
MNAYIKLATFEYPRHEGDIRLEHPEILESQTGATFPCPATYAVVEYTESPSCNPQTQMAYQIQPQIVAGVWKAAWSIRNLTQDELDARSEVKAMSEMPITKL